MNDAEEEHQYIVNEPLSSMSWAGRGRLNSSANARRLREFHANDYAHNHWFRAWTYFSNVQHEK